MKIKNAKFYTIFSIIILIFIISSGYALNKLSAFARETYQPLPLYRVSFTVLFLFGGMLGLESLLNEKNKDGKWSLNPLKLIILGGSSLLIIVWRWFPVVFGHSHAYSESHLSPGNLMEPTC